MFILLFYFSIFLQTFGVLHELNDTNFEDTTNAATRGHYDWFVVFYNDSEESSTMVAEWERLSEMEFKYDIFFGKLYSPDNKHTRRRFHVSYLYP